MCWFSHSVTSTGAAVSQHAASCHHLSVCVLTCVFPASVSPRCTGLASSQPQWNQCQVLPSLICAAEPDFIHVSEELALGTAIVTSVCSVSHVQFEEFGLRYKFFSLDGINEQEQQQLQPQADVQNQGDSCEGHRCLLSTLLASWERPW